ncbi:hypothetical protein GCM10011583_19170 [Streptomyces camponoticapitis]|uniref:Uncharacterized protein n=1 Tax=Streptomyces camponoticapitis TaxID=1616125 RepID=A0ABQ2E1N8_9ACTN|nr:hypothetical protein GCM10011583_19170 [Streptomyces camponoticapitis]
MRCMTDITPEPFLFAAGAALAVDINFLQKTRHRREQGERGVAATRETRRAAMWSTPMSGVDQL